MTPHVIAEHIILINHQILCCTFNSLIVFAALLPMLPTLLRTYPTLAISIDSLR